MECKIKQSKLDILQSTGINKDECAWIKESQNIATASFEHQMSLIKRNKEQQKHKQVVMRQK